MSKFKVGDRVVVVSKEGIFPKRRGKVLSFRDEIDFPVRVLLDSQDEVFFDFDELELESVYDALSAPPAESELVVNVNVPDDLPDLKKLVSSVADKVDTRLEDSVNHPSHYTSHPSGIEAIQITEHMNFNLGNATKYVWRAGLKSDDPIQDLHKARWYIEREIQRLGGSV